MSRVLEDDEVAVNINSYKRMKFRDNTFILAVVCASALAFGSLISVAGAGAEIQNLKLKLAAKFPSPPDMSVSDADATMAKFEFLLFMHDSDVETFRSRCDQWRKKWPEKVRDEAIVRIRQDQQQARFEGNYKKYYND